jgi:hypothetical protein
LQYQIEKSEKKETMYQVTSTKGVDCAILTYLGIRIRTLVAAAMHELTISEAVQAHLTPLIGHWAFFQVDFCHEPVYFGGNIGYLRRYHWCSKHLVKEWRISRLKTLTGTPNVARQDKTGNASRAECLNGYVIIHTAN